jgi:hypothetical protein
MKVKIYKIRQLKKEWAITILITQLPTKSFFCVSESIWYTAYEISYFVTMISNFLYICLIGDRSLSAYVLCLVGLLMQNNLCIWYSINK